MIFVTNVEYKKLIFPCFERLVHFKIFPNFLANSKFLFSQDLLTF